MKKILNKVRQWRLVGYITIGVGMAQAGIEPQTIVIDMFLLILLTEIASRKGTKPTTPQEFKKELGTKKDSAPRTK